MIVADLAHLVVGDLGQPLDAEAERRAPQARRRLEILPAVLVVDEDALAPRDDRRALLEVLAQVRLGMHEARDVERVQAVRQTVHVC